LIPALFVGCLALAGCQSLPMPVPSGSSTPSGGALDGVSGDQAPTGSTVIGKLGDPCSLLTAGEIQQSLGVAVLGVVRGEVQSNGSQVCAYAMDAPGSTAAALGSFVGTLGTGEAGQVVDAMGSSGGVFGVVLQPVDPNDSSNSSSDGEGSTEPGITVTKVQLGAGGAVVATPNGGSAFASDGTTTTLMLMDLIAGTPSSDALQALLTKAYGRL
jgi:hypothetical protein